MTARAIDAIVMKTVMSAPSRSNGKNIENGMPESSASMVCSVASRYWSAFHSSHFCRMRLSSPLSRMVSIARLSSARSLWLSLWTAMA